MVTYIAHVVTVRYYARGHLSFLITGMNGYRMRLLERSLNVALDAISFKFNPRIYNKIRALNEREIKKSKLFEKLAQKFLDS